MHNLEETTQYREWIEVCPSTWWYSSTPFFSSPAMFWLVLVACLLGETVILWALPIRLLVALPSEDVPKLSKGLFRTLGEDMNATMLAVPDDILQLVDTVCDGLSKFDPHLLVSFLPSRRNFYMAMMTGQAGLPVLNLARQYTHKAAKVSFLIIFYF